MHTPNFVIRVYGMVDDPSSDSVVSWGKSNRSFIIWNPEEFSRTLLWSTPGFLCFDMTTFFIRLKHYGFKRLRSGHVEFGNTYFVRGKPELLKYMGKQRLQQLKGIQAKKKKDELAIEKEVVDRFPLLRI